MLPTILTAWLFGFKGGIRAVLVHYSVSLVMIAMETSLAGDIEMITRRWPGAIGIGIVGLLIGWLRDFFLTLQQEQLSLQQARQELDIRIQERTTELANTNVSLQQALQESHAHIQNEKEMQESRARLAALVESSDDAIISQNLDGFITSWNHGAERLYGYTADEMIGHRFSEVLPEEQRQEAVQIYQRLLSGKRIISYEAIRRHKDGHDINVILSVSPIRDTTGAQIGISLIARDISERLAMENRLRQQNAYLTTLHQITLGVIRQLRTDDLLENIVQRTTHLFNATYGYIEMFNAEETEAITLVTVGEISDIGFRRNINQGIGGVVREAGEPYAINDYQNWTKRIKGEGYDKIYSVAAAPLKSGEKVIGILGVSYTSTQHTFTSEQIAILGQIAQLTSVVIYNIKLFEQTQNEIAERKRAEEELKTSQARLLAVIESTHEAIWSIDLDMNLLTFNSRYIELMVELYGKIPQVGQSTLERMPPERAEFWHGHYTRVLQGERFNLERRLDNHIFDYSLNPILRGGQIIGAVIFSKDITERKRSEEELKASQARLSALFESTDEAIWSVDKEYRVVTFNSHWAKEYESTYHLPATSGLTLTQRLQPERIEIWRSHYERAFKGERFTVEHPATIAGEQHIKEYSLNPIITDHKITGAVVFAKDITERKRTEEALRRSEATLQAIFNNIPQAVILLDKERRIIAFNKAADESSLITSGIKLQAGKLMYDFLRDDNSKRGFDLTFTSALEGRAVRAERSVERDNLPPIWFDVSYMPVMTEDGDVFGVCLSRLDITQSKQAEENLRESEARLRAIAEATPIPIIISTLEDDVTLYANAALSQLMQLPLEPMIGKPIAPSFVNPAEHEILIAELKTQGSLRNREVQLRRRDGTPMWVSLSSELIKFSGRPCIMTGIYDITERKHVEERERAITQGLRAVVEATDELLGYDDLDILYRRAVELAREKLKVERCAIFLLDASRENLLGTYGTDIKGETTDEHHVSTLAFTHQELFLPTGPLWSITWNNTRTTLLGDQITPLDTGWIATTVIRIGDQPVGIFSHDTAITHAPFNETTQESVVIYCSLLGHIIERKMNLKAIQTSLKEKEVLLKEVHHRVKNNMQVIVSMINLQANYIEDPVVLTVFSDTQSRVRAMALVHEKLYQSDNLAQIDFSDYLQHLSSSLFSTYRSSAHPIKLNIEVAEINLGVDVAIPCGLIVNELISNALKYAFPDQRPGELTIQLRELAPQQIELIVADDGVGLPPQIDFNKSETLGMQLIQSLTLQIKGTVELERKQGTKFTIQFPLS